MLGKRFAGEEDLGDGRANPGKDGPCALYYEPFHRENGICHCKALYAAGGRGYFGYRENPAGAAAFCPYSGSGIGGGYVPGCAGLL